MLPTRIQRVLLPALILLVYVGLRLWAYHGISTVPAHTFFDQILHMYHLELMAKQATLAPELLTDRFLEDNPELLRRAMPFRWPGGVYHAALPWAMLFGPTSILTVQLTNALFTVLLLWGMVGLARELGFPRAGLWAGLLMVLTPVHVSATWHLTLDYPLAAMCLVGLLLLWQTRGFRLVLPSVNFGLWSALGVYVKLTYLLYLIVPAALVLLIGLWRGPRPRVVAHSLLATTLCAGLVTAMLSPDWGIIWQDFVTHASSHELPATQIPAGSARWFVSQPLFAALNFPYPLLLAALPGLVLLHGRRQPTVRWLLLAFFWGTLLVLTLMSNKLERYLFPLYPLLWLAAAYWAERWVAGRWRRLVLGALAALHAVVLVIAFQVPTPWHLSDDVTSPAHWEWNELRLPGTQRLRRIRQDPMWDLCGYRAVSDQVVRLAKDDRRRRPLVMVMLWESKTIEDHRFFGELVLQVAQRLRHRLVLAPSLMPITSLPPYLQQAPHLVVLHHPGWKAPRWLRPRDRRTIATGCGGRSPQIVVSRAYRGVLEK